jgi:hypothetical protein
MFINELNIGVIEFAENGDLNSYLKNHQLVGELNSAKTEYVIMFPRLASKNDMGFSTC